MAYVNTGAYDKWLKAQEQARVAEAYNTQKAALDEKYDSGGLGGFLGGLVRGLGKTIGDVGKGVGGLIGTGAASVGDLVNSVKDGKVTNEATNSFKRFWYGGEDDKDAAAKAAGTSLNAASTLATTVVPGAGAGTAAGKIAAGTAANTAAGAIGGIADELEEQGKNATFENAANRTISGAAAGLATGGLNKKLGNATSKVGSALLNNNLATSTIGRGALSGAVGGSVGAGTSAALSGGDVAGAALQGGLTGAAAGATQAGIMSGASKLGNKALNKLNEVQRSGDSKLMNIATDMTSNSGEFGKEYTMFAGGDDPYNAINYIDQRRRGIAKGALPSSGSGNVDLPYGNQDYYVNQRTGKNGGGFGLAHISNDNGRTINDAYNMVDTLRNGQIIPDTDTTRSVYLDDANSRKAVLSTDRYGKTVEPYAVSAYDLDNKIASTAESRLNRDTVEANTNSVSQKARNVKDFPSANYRDDSDLALLRDVVSNDRYQRAASSRSTSSNSEALRDSVLSDMRNSALADLTDRVEAPNGLKDALNKGKITESQYRDAVDALYRDSLVSQLSRAEKQNLVSLALGNGRSNSIQNSGQLSTQVQNARSSQDPTASGASRSSQSISPMESAAAPSEIASYGESGLANRTKRGMTAEALSRVGNTLEGAQSNITRAAARDLGIESTGKVIENVRKKTGITNLETQGKLAKELTGGADSLLDQIQRNALSATEDGKPFYVDTSDVIRSVDGIVDSYADSNTFGSENSKARFANNLKNDIANGSSDVLSTANRMKASAADLRGKGIVDPSAKDKASAKIYSEIANRLDDLSYSAIPQENVDTMFDVAILEMKARANAASENGNPQIAKAYNQLASSLDAEPRTVKAFRSFKKDFVDVSKIDALTAQAENGAAQQMGQSFAGNAKKMVNTLLQRPVNAGLAKLGGGINQIASAVDGVSSAGTPSQASQAIPISQGTQTVLGNLIGRTAGIQGADNNIQELRKEQEYQNLEDMLSGIKEAETVTSPNVTSSYGVGANGNSGARSRVASQLADISNGMELALAAGDVKSYSQLADLYNTAYSIYKSQTASEENNLTTSEKNQLAKLQSAGTALDELEALYTKAGGGQGVIGGNIANFLGNLGLNSDVSTYNQLAQGLINQIGAAIGKTDSLNTEGEVQRALSLVPKMTDDQQTAMNKLATLRSLLSTNTSTYSTLYS